MLNVLFLFKQDYVIEKLTLVLDKSEFDFNNKVLKYLQFLSVELESDQPEMKLFSLREMSITKTKDSLSGAHALP